MKLIELINARKALANISTSGMKMPFPIAYKISKFMSETQHDEDFYNEKVTDIFKEYGETDDEGKIVVPKEDRDKVEPLMKELTETEIEDCSIRFSSEDFGGMDVFVQDCVALLPIID